MCFSVLRLIFVEKSVVPEHVSVRQFTNFAPLQRKELRLTEQDLLGKKKGYVEFLWFEN